MKIATICAIGVLISGAVAAEPAEPTGIGNFIEGGKAALSFRYRYEGVDDDGFVDKAKASTLRTRLGLESGVVGGFAFKVEFDDIRDVFLDRKAAGTGDGNRPPIADPEDTDLNQAYVDYRGWDAVPRLGRQRINLDNQRFIGGVGWRQNEQTFDALSIRYNQKFSAFYSYVDQVKRIFGRSSPAGTHDLSGTHLVNAGYDFEAIGKLVGYFYRIKNDDVSAFSTQTFGARFAGRRPINDNAIRYAAELARQSDVSNNPTSFEATYSHLELGFIVKDLDLGVGWEVLSGSAGNVPGQPSEAFRTPLATLHAFNGWADKFLATPDAGLDDLYFKLSWPWQNFIGQIRFHRFNTEDGGDKLADEVDLRVGYKFTNRFRGDLYYATYNGKNNYTVNGNLVNNSDTQKVWAMLVLTL